MTRRRKLKLAILRSRIPFKAVLARGYLRSYERYRALRGARYGGSYTGEIALPSPRQRVLVAGTADVDWFLDSGKAQFDYLRRLLVGVGRPLEQMDALLDFGCGCGRIARWFAAVSGPRIDACDYNPELVEWCARNLPFIRASATGLRPPLPYADAAFDLLYAFSVFTHLSAQLAEQWMSELGRVVRPGGLVWFTIHGESYKDRLLGEERTRFRAGQIVVRLPEIEGTNLCSSYWPDTSIERMLGNEFEMLVHLDPSADPVTAKTALLEHDAYLVRRV